MGGCLSKSEVKPPEKHEVPRTNQGTSNQVQRTRFTDKYEEANKNMHGAYTSPYGLGHDHQSETVINNSEDVPLDAVSPNAPGTVSPGTKNRFLPTTRRAEEESTHPENSSGHFPVQQPRPLMPCSDDEERELSEPWAEEDGPEWTPEDFPADFNYEQFLAALKANLEAPLNEKEAVQDAMHPHGDDKSVFRVYKANAKKKVTGDTLVVKQPMDLRVNIDHDAGALSGLDIPSTSAATSTDILSTHQQQEIDEENLSHVKLLGAGRTGKVHLMMWYGSEVAVKEFYSNDPSENERYFSQESENLNVLKHPCVVFAYGHTMLNNHPAIVMENIPGGSLRSQLRALRKREQRSAGWSLLKLKYQIALQAASAVEYLHSKHLIHFDLKADNFLCDLHDTSKPVVKVADVGLSKIKVTAFVSGNMRGTLPWMAPELMPGFRATEDHLSSSPDQVDQKVDIYSFGVVLWEIWTCGAEPHRGLSATEALYGYLSGNLQHSVPNGCPRQWGDLMLKCWERNPVRRPTIDMITTKLSSCLQELLH